MVEMVPETAEKTPKKHLILPFRLVVISGYFLTSAKKAWAPFGHRLGTE